MSEPVHYCLSFSTTGGKSGPIVIPQAAIDAALNELPLTDGPEDYEVRAALEAALRAWLGEP